MKYKHLTLDDRKVIESGLDNDLTKIQIANQIGKDPSTVGKEIKVRRLFKSRNHFNADSICIHLKECHKCYSKCDRYEEPKCTRRDFKGVCNACDKTNKCKLDKYFYKAENAQKQYISTLSDARQGFNLNTTDVANIVDIIKPLLRKGQSLYTIVKNHPELNLSVRSLYTYIESGIFKDYGIDNFSLRKQVSMKKRKSKLRKRKEPVNYNGRRYEDYIAFIEDNPNLSTTEMDTVYNSQSGPFIQTFIFQNTGLMIGFLHKEKTSESMSSTLNYLQDILGDDYYKLFSVILTDRGSEFEKHNLFEINSETGELRTNIFYCDPQSPEQKPHVENNHRLIRNILPKGKSLKLLTQEDIDLMFSHINSLPRAALGDKTPYEAFSFLYNEDILKKLNIQKIEKDMVTLQPYLLKK